MYQTLSVTIEDTSQTGEARRAAQALSDQCGFDTTTGGQLAIVATELATNLARHGGGGRLFLNRVQDDGKDGIEVIALDSGPGMADIDRCLEDGYSTGGSSGVGLGAVVRQASEFDIYSRHSKGTIVLARIWAKTPATTRVGSRFGAVCLPYPGEQVSGDGWYTRADADFSLVVVADGLGHGLLAADASRIAVEFCGKLSTWNPQALLEAMHGPLRPTRGAAVAIASIDHQRRLVSYAGIGNIAGTVIDLDGKSRSLVSLSGIVGHEMRRVQTFETPWQPGSSLIMHSDGLGSSWRLNQYPGLQARDPGLIASLLIRDFTRGRDDVTVVAMTDTRRPV